MTEPLRFKNGSFTLMQITDAQENYTVNPDTVKLISLALDRVKPDLVVFTGDQLKGYSPSFKGDTLRKISRTIADLLRPLEDRKIPFCVTFGNHDNNCGVSNARQAAIYASHAGYVPGTPHEGNDPGTFTLQLKDSLGKRDVFNLYVFDSGGKGPDGVYQPLTPDRIAWFRRERDRFYAENGAYLPSLAFQHIPLPEYFDLLKRVEKGTKGAVEAFYKHEGEYYVLPDEAIARGDFMLESPAAPDDNTGELDALTEKGDVLGLYVGHDHINSFSIAHRGMQLGYTQGCGFHTYGPGGRRGVRVFKLREDDLSRFETYTVTMDDLCNYQPAKPVTEFVLTHMPSSPRQVMKYVPHGILITGAAAALSIGASLMKKKK